MSRYPRSRPRQPAFGAPSSPLIHRLQSVCLSLPHSQSGDSGAASEQPRNEGGNDVEANPGNNLHVSGLAMRTTDQDLEEIFGKFGKVGVAPPCADWPSHEEQASADLAPYLRAPR